MEQKNGTNRLVEFRAKLREEAMKVWRGFEIDRRIWQRNWVVPRRERQLWNEIPFK